MAHVSSSWPGKYSDRRIRGQNNKIRKNYRLAKAFTNPRPTGLCFQKAEGGDVWPPKTYPRLAILPAPQTLKCASHGVCGRLFLARLPQVFPAAQAEPGLLEGEDRGEPEKGSIGKRTAKKAGVEGDTDKRVRLKT